MKPYIILNICGLNPNLNYPLQEKELFNTEKETDFKHQLKHNFRGQAALIRVFDSHLEKSGDKIQRGGEKILNMNIHICSD